MYAQVAPIVSLPRSVALHTPAELAYAGCDDITGIVEFTAPSASAKRQAVNTVSYDTTTRAVHCDCVAAMTGRACWHAAWVVTAWERHQAMREARALLGPQLLAFGRKHARLTGTYRVRVGRAGEYDAVRLLAARYEWRHRRALDAAPLALAA